MDSSRLLAKRYRLVEYLGGSEAAVYRGYDRQLRRDVAVKIGRAGSPGFEPERFENEMRTLASLRHPALVTLYDAGIDDGDGGNPYLVMQYVPGVTLAERLRSRGSLLEPEVRRIGLALVAAAAYLHREGVVHRDIKPANVLLSASGEVYLADLGIARSADTAGLTGAGELLGTPAYLAPEQVRTEQVGAPCDIYALGLVLLECFTGQREYRGTPVESAIMRLTRPPLIPTALSPRWRSLLADMTAVDPDRRPTALAVAARLDALDAPASRVTPRRLIAGVAAAAAVVIAGATATLATRPDAGSGPATSANAAIGGRHEPAGRQPTALAGGMHQAQPLSADSTIQPVPTDSSRPDAAGPPSTTVPPSTLPPSTGTGSPPTAIDVPTTDPSPTTTKTKTKKTKKAKKAKKAKKNQDEELLAVGDSGAAV